MYKEIKVWKRLNESEAICYRCFQSIETNKYYVQSSDYFRLPVEKIRIDESEKQFVELFIEDDPCVRTDGFNSLKEAIENNEDEFE